VTFGDSSYGRVRVEVQMPSGEAEVKAGSLAFGDQDPLAERFGATGLLVASLASEQDAPMVEEPAPGLSSEPLTAAALAAGGLLVGGAPVAQAGGFLSVAVPLHVPRFFGSMSLGFARYLHQDPNGVSAQWLSLGGGAGIETPLVGPNLRLRGEMQVFAENLRATVRDPASSLQDAGNRALAGVMTEVSVVIRVTGTAGILVGGNLSWASDSTIIRVHGKPESFIPQGSYGALLGLHLDLR
jgi:hypothetical protein